MSSLYSSPPASPVAGFFPTGPASPHAFASFQQDPRTAHSMYSALGASTKHNTVAVAQRNQAAQGTDFHGTSGGGTGLACPQAVLHSHRPASRAIPIHRIPVF
ncbi:hypothetical protein C8Q80DRAFT_1264440 [Daedaleopsis nitida]|nr:hypothetical protein C8Q80DRAFT_1264440 [Daedaleopsis nitida]